MAITREQVFGVCDEIFYTGKTPRIEAVRTFLGSGSYSTIGKYLKEWKEQNPDSVNVSTSEIPPELHNAAYEAIKPVIALIWDKASESVNSDRLKTLELENERYQQQTAELAGLRTVTQALLARNEQLSQDLALARAGVGIEDVNGFLQLQSDFELLKQERDELNSHCLAVTLDLEEAKTCEKVLLNRVEALEAERLALVELNQQLKIENAEISTLTERLGEKEAECTHLRKQLPKKGVVPLEVDFDVQPIISERNELKAEVERLDTELAQLRQQEYLNSLEIKDEGTKKPAGGRRRKLGSR